MIRYLEKDEKQNCRLLYEHCFEEDGKTYTDYYFEKCLPENIVAVNEKEDQLVSALHLIPKNVRIGAMKTEILYIYGVGTFLPYRKKGYMKELFLKVLGDMQKEAEPFTYLIPSDEKNAEIYHNIGFSYVMDRPNMKPPETRKKATHSLILRKAENADLIRLAFFAQSSMAGKYKISLVKDIHYFQRLRELIEAEGGSMEIYVENKVVVGYRIWIDGEIFEEVLDPAISTMSCLENEGSPYAMVRIVDIERTLKMFGCRENMQKIVKISDSLLEKNNGCFRWRCKNGKVSLDRMDEKQLNLKPEFDVTIAELTAHIFGYSTIEGLPKVCKKGSFFINDYV